MTNEDKIKLFDNNEERLIRALDDTDPTSPEFGQALRNLADLRATIFYYMRDGGITATSVDAKKVFAPAFEDQTPPPCEPAPLAVEEPYVEEPPYDGPTYTKADLTKMMKDARVKGVNITAIIKSFGVDNLADIDPTQYPAVVAALEKETN